MQEQTQFQIMTSFTISRTFLFYLYASIALYGSINYSDIFLYIISVVIAGGLLLYSTKNNKDKIPKSTHISFLTSIPFLLAIISGFMEYSALSFLLFSTGCIGFLLSDFLLLKAKQIQYKQFLLNITYTILISLFMIFTFINQKIQIELLILSFIPLFFYFQEEIIKRIK